MTTDADEERARWPLAFIAVHPGTPREQVVGIHDFVVIGRECNGVEESRRVLLDDQAVSRRHAEIRLDPASDRACVFDVSTNGTRLNGSRVDHATEVQLVPGDRLTIGGAELEFRAERFLGEHDAVADDARSTMRAVSLTLLAMAAGDVIGYSAISQYTEEHILLKSMDQLFGELRTLLTRHRGTLNNHVGDGFFAIWEADHDPDAADHSLSFALAAVDLVREVAVDLPLRTPDDEPIRVGWGVEFGQAAVSAMTGAHLAVLGDATNVAVELSGAAGRDGRAEVVTTARVQTQLADTFEFTDPEDFVAKGRLGAERIYGVRRRLG